MASIVAAAGTVAPLNLSPTPRRSLRHSSTSLSAAPFLPQIRCSISPQNPNSSTQNPNFPAKSLFSLRRASPLALTALSVGSGFLIHLLATGDGGFGNSDGGFGGSGGGGGGGGAGGGGFWSRLQSYLVANVKEDESQSEWDPYTVA